jgi:cell division protein ZapA (FtsZ GTPase activity inhibitor)
MKREAKSYKVSILGEQYSLVSDEPEGHVMQSALMVDSLLREIAEKSGSADTKKVAVLAALQLASRLVYAQIHIERENLQKEALSLRINQELSNSGRSDSTTTMSHQKA